MARKPSPAQRSILSVYWTNPHTSPPGDGERILWSCTVLDRRAENEILAAHAPAVPLGGGYGHGITIPIAPGRKLSAETKAKIRRRNLRRRIERQAPLFADEFFAAEIERRPDYFDGN